MDISETTFIELQTVLQRLAQTAGKASNAIEFRALLLADIGAPYHSFDVLAISSNLANLGDRLSTLITEDLDADGALL